MPLTNAIWTEGVCEDGAAILRDGVAVPISALLVVLNNRERLLALLSAMVKAEEAAKEINDAVSLQTELVGLRAFAAEVRAGVNDCKSWRDADVGFARVKYALMMLDGGVKT